MGIQLSGLKSRARVVISAIVTEGNQFFRREYHFGKECYEAGFISPLRSTLRVDTLVNDADVFTKALNGAEMGRMVPRLCGYFNESRHLPVQPIGQHKARQNLEKGVWDFVKTGSKSKYSMAIPGSPLK